MTIETNFNTCTALEHIQAEAQRMLDRITAPGEQIDITLIATRPGEPETASCVSSADSAELIDILAAASAFVKRRSGRG